MKARAGRRPCFASTARISASTVVSLHLVAVASLCAGPAGADEIVQVRAVPALVFFDAADTGGSLQQLPITISRSFDRFDTALGELTSIEYAWDLRFGVTLDVMSVGGGSGGVTGLFQVDGTTLSGDGGGNGGGADLPGLLIADYVVDGSLQVDPAVAAEAQVLPFLGHAGQTVDVVYSGLVSGRSTGNATVTHELLDGSSVTLRYVFTVPEPGAALASLAASTALAALGCQRARA